MKIQWIAALACLAMALTSGDVTRPKEGAGRGREGVPDRQADLRHRLQRGQLLHSHGVRGRQMEKDRVRLLRDDVSAEMLTSPVSDAGKAPLVRGFFFD